MGLKLAFLCTLLAAATVCSAQEPGGAFESLFEDYDPPAGSWDLSGDPETWPGHGEQLGRAWPRRKVSELDHIPSREEFLSEWVSARKPVLIKGLMTKMTEKMHKVFDGLDMSSSASLERSGRAALALIHAGSADSPGTQTKSLREVLKERRVQKETGDSAAGKVYSWGHLSRVLKTQVLMPPPLLCSNVAGEALVDTHHRYFDFPFPFPLIQVESHQLHCMAEGRSSVLLADEPGGDFPTWRDMPLKEDHNFGGRILGVFVDVSNVNLKITPQLRDIKKFHVSELSTGDCLYVPAGWVAQKTVLAEGEHSIEIRWRALDGEPELQCGGRLPHAMTLGDAAWPAEGVEKPPDKTADKERKALDLLSHMVEQYVLASSSPTDLAKFSKKFEMDPRLTLHLPQWNDECAGIAEDMFNVLDRNSDGELDEADVAGIADEAELLHWAGRALDKEKDISEVIFDMRVDRAGEPPADPRAPDAAQYVAKTEEYEEGLEKEYYKDDEEDKQAAHDEL